MTLFAVVCAGIFPVDSHGSAVAGVLDGCRIPNTRGSLWVNFKSPLLWDVFAISTYLLINLGGVLVHRVASRFGDAPPAVEIPDGGIGSRGILCLGWDGSAKTWHRYETVYMLLAGLGDAAGLFRPHHRQHGLRDVGHSRLAHDRYSRLTLSLVRSSAGWPWS